MKLFAIIYITLILLLSIYSGKSLAQTYIKGPGLIEGITNTATAGGSTALTKDSQTIQRFTGTLNQDVVLPDATTIPVGRYFIVTNRSTGIITVKDDGGNTLTTVLADTQKKITVLTVGTANGTWDIESWDIDLSSEVTGILPLANGGTNKNATASAGSVVYSDADSFELSAVGSSSQVFQSGGAGAPSWSTATYPSTTTINELLYSSANNTITGLATANIASLVTDGSGVPSLSASSADGQVLRRSAGILGFGALDLADADAVTGLLPLSNGGTNKNATASAGAIVYSDADSFELSAVGSSGQIFQSNGTGAPSWTTATYPSTTTANQLLYSSSNNVVAGLASANVASLITDGTGVPSLSASSADGQVLRRSSGALSFGALDLADTDAVTGVLDEANGGTGNSAYAKGDLLVGTGVNTLGTLTVGTNDFVLTADSAQVTGTKWALPRSDRLVNSDLTLTASDTIGISLITFNQTWRVQGNSSAVTLSNTPFGSSAPLEGARITLIGNDNTNTVTLSFNDAAKGCLLNGNATLAAGESIELEYNSTLDRYVEISRSF